jgi:hypothetical protein
MRIVSHIAMALGVLSFLVAQFGRLSVSVWDGEIGLDNVTTFLSAIGWFLIAIFVSLQEKKS